MCGLMNPYAMQEFIRIPEQVMALEAENKRLRELLHKVTVRAVFHLPQSMVDEVSEILK
jgi:hypothetical protein